MTSGIDTSYDPIIATSTLPESGGDDFSFLSGLVVCTEQPGAQAVGGVEESTQGLVPIAVIPEDVHNAMLEEMGLIAVEPTIVEPPVREYEDVALPQPPEGLHGVQRAVLDLLDTIFSSGTLTSDQAADYLARIGSELATLVAGGWLSQDEADALLAPVTDVVNQMAAGTATVAQVLPTVHGMQAQVFQDVMAQLQTPSTDASEPSDATVVDASEPSDATVADASEPSDATVTDGTSAA